MTTQLSLPQGRIKLAAVLQNSGGIVRTADVEQSLNISRSTASKLLSRWASQRWLERIGSGTYAAIDTCFVDRGAARYDSWSIVPELFAPAYIGGLSMIEHWDLTKQIFRPIFVVTGRPVRSKNQKILRLPYIFKHIRPDKIFGLEYVWYENIKIAISDLPRTIVDIFDDPLFGGGINHVIECFDEYTRHDGRQDEKLISYAERLGNGAVFKRLGFVAEHMPDCTYLVDACKKRLTKGNAKIDPTYSCPRLVTRWHLWVPENDFQYERDGY